MVIWAYYLCHVADGRMLASAGWVYLPKKFQMVGSARRQEHTKPGNAKNKRQIGKTKIGTVKNTGTGKNNGTCIWAQ